MRVIEEPFTTREEILRTLRPMQATTARPFATLRRSRAASDGLRVTLRTPGGRLMGQVRLYSALNSDAARVFRHRDVKLAQELARRAGRLEGSASARLLQQAVGEAAAQLPLDPRSRDAPPALRRYVEMRQGRPGLGTVDTAALVGEWVAQSAAWFAERHDVLSSAIAEMDHKAAEARADLLPPGDLRVSTFCGTVARMDALHAEIDGGDGQAFLVSRDQLREEGLAAIGQAVTVLEETVPGGRFSRVLPAVALEAPETHGGSPYVLSPYDEGPDRFPFAVLNQRDHAWFKRALDRPVPVPVAPLRIA